MEVESFSLGSFQTNSFIAWCAGQKECLVIDVGDSPNPLQKFMDERSFEPVAVVLTHGHADHMLGVKSLKSAYPEMQLWVGKGDAKQIRNPLKNLSALFLRPMSLPPPDRLLEGGDKIEVGKINLEVIEVPGHTAGSIALYSREDSVIFCGDTLFSEGIGRTDLPGGSHEMLLKSIKENLLNLPEDTIVYPGHGPETTVGREKKHNPFLAGEDAQAF
jgi:glyoxylase-like metal-dependent hydrolase (beta-lactamase superfamily II)